MRQGSGCPMSLAEGNIARRTREAIGLTQVELAAILGVHAITISKWERGKLAPNPYPLALLEAFATSKNFYHEVGADARALLASDGPIAALHCLLRPGFEEHVQRWGGRRSQLVRNAKAAVKARRRAAA
jgi:putative transcriptional regulator